MLVSHKKFITNLEGDKMSENIEKCKCVPLWIPKVFIDSLEYEAHKQNNDVVNLLIDAWLRVLSKNLKNKLEKDLNQYFSSEKGENT